jgi:hypothetical protein
MAPLPKVSTFMRHTLLTSAIDKILARQAGWNKTWTTLLTVPTWDLICMPPLVCRQRGLMLPLMMDSNCGFLKTDTVDWLLSRIHVSGMILRLRW